MKFTDKKFRAVKRILVWSVIMAVIFASSGMVFAEEAYDDWSAFYDETEQLEQDAEQPLLYAEDYAQDLLVSESPDDWKTGEEEYLYDDISAQEQDPGVYDTIGAEAADTAYVAETVDTLPAVQTPTTDTWTIYTWAYLQDPETEEYTYSAWDQNIEIAPEDAGAYLGAEVYLAGMEPGYYKVSVQLADDPTGTWTSFIKEETVTIQDAQESAAGKIVRIAFGEDIPEAYRMPGLYHLSVSVTGISEDPAFALSKYDYAYEEGWDLRASYKIQEQETAETEAENTVSPAQDPAAESWTVYSWVYLQDPETEEYIYSDWDKNIEVTPEGLDGFLGVEVYLAGMEPGEYKVSIQLMDDLTGTWTAFIKEETVTIQDADESAVGKIVYIPFGEEIPDTYRASGLYHLSVSVTDISDGTASALSKYDYAYEEGWDLRASYRVPGEGDPSQAGTPADPSAPDPSDPSVLDPSSGIQISGEQGTYAPDPTAVYLTSPSGPSLGGDSIVTYSASAGPGGSFGPGGGIISSSTDPLSYYSALGAQTGSGQSPAASGTDKTKSTTPPASSAGLTSTSPISGIKTSGTTSFGTTPARNKIGSQTGSISKAAAEDTSLKILSGGTGKTTAGTSAAPGSVPGQGRSAAPSTPGDSSKVSAGSDPAVKMQDQEPETLPHGNPPKTGDENNLSLFIIMAAAALLAAGAAVLILRKRNTQ